MADVNIPKELSSIDFKSMIGGPLNAVIRAQTQSAINSVDFIKSVGFDDKNHPVMVTFKYMKDLETVPDPQKPDDIKLVPTEFQLSVPILMMLPIPFIRVEETEIDFNAKINSLQQDTTTTNAQVKGAIAAKAGWGPFSVTIKANFSAQKSTSATSKIERTYSMKVHVKAVQDELPAGTERLLGILEETIKDDKSEKTQSGGGEG